MGAVFKFNDEQEMVRKAARDFAKAEIAPHAAEWDSKDICPVELWPALGDVGASGTFVPEAYGGVGMGHVERAIFIEEISRYSGGLGIALMTHHLAIEAILKYGTEEQKAKYLPELACGLKMGGLAVTEPGGGSDFAGQLCSAEKVDGGWILNGRKCFITNAGVADVNVIICKTGADEKGRGILSAFIVEKGAKGLKPGRHENKLGLRGSITGDVILDNCNVSDDAIIGKIGDGTKIGMGAIGEVGRAGMTAICVGLLRAACEDAVKFANERIVSGKPIAKLQAVQLEIAEIRADYEAAKALLYVAASLKDENKPAMTAYAIAKLFATEAAVRGARRCMDIMGGYGVVNEYAAGRYLRDALASIPSGGTSQIQKLIIAGDTLKNF
jgi:alkylation response protein AidB-like acyl-CoA dehydrogenase